MSFRIWASPTRKTILPKTSRSDRLTLGINSGDLRWENFWIRDWVLLPVDWTFGQGVLRGSGIEEICCSNNHYLRVLFNCTSRVTVIFYNWIGSRIFITREIRGMFVAATTIRLVPPVRTDALAIGSVQLRIGKLSIRLVQVTSQANQFLCQLRTLLHLLNGKISIIVQLLCLRFILLHRFFLIYNFRLNPLWLSKLSPYAFNDLILLSNQG